MKEEEKARKACLSALSTARLAISKKYPYYGTVVYGLIPRMAPGYGTLGVTPGMVLVIDPIWYVNMEKEIDKDLQGVKRKEAADEMRAGVLIHEAHHILRGMSRIETLIAAGEDRGTVNKMFDIPINDNLKDSDDPAQVGLLFQHLRLSQRAHRRTVPRALQEKFQSPEESQVHGQGQGG